MPYLAHQPEGPSRHKMTKERFYAAACVAALLLCTAASLKISGALPHARRSEPPPIVAFDMTRLMLSHADTVQIVPGLSGAGGPEEEKPIGAGFAARADGVIVTARSVVAGAKEVRVRFKNGSTLLGDVYTNDSSPLAVIRVDANGLNPFGFIPRPISGLLMAMRQGRRGGGPAEMVSFTGQPRPDGAAIVNSPSGGIAGEPLVDVMGRVVAVNLGAAKPGRDRGKYVTLDAGPAIRCVQRLLASTPATNEDVTTGRPPLAVKLGIQVADATPAALYSYCLSRGSKGAIVAAVFPDSPAMRGHMRVGDLLVEMGGKKIRRAEDVAGLVEALVSDQDAGIVVERLGGRFLLPVTAGRSHGRSTGSPALAASDIGGDSRIASARRVRHMPD